MKHYRKTFVGSIIAFVLGTSCCWLSSIAIWIGGSTLLTALIVFIEDIQSLLLFLAALLAVSTIYLLFKNKSRG